MSSRATSHDPAGEPRPEPRTATGADPIVKVREVRPDGYDGTCLRPLGLCELGGCCDACWYRPDHPRFTGK
ncbi:MAG: hypothetical protein GY906_17330 [bacterium]|nr:hypothetical protein [bacterium]